MEYFRRGCLTLAGLAQCIRVLACGLKSPRFDSIQGHMPGFQAQLPIEDMQEAADQ